MRDFDKQMEMVLYHSDEGDVSVDAYIKDESIWITRQDLMPKQRMAEIGHLWAEWYLIYTLFTPFDLGRNTPLKERTKDMIKILFVCWGKRFQ